MKKKNLMAIFVTCIILFGSVAGMSLARTSDMPQAGDVTEILGEITMTGSAQIQSKPDQVVILLSIQVRDTNSAVPAKDKVAQIIDRVLQSLKQLGLSDDDIETTSYNIQLEYDWVNGEQTFKDYLVICSMKVTVKDFDDAGKVIDASVNAGAFVTSINFELSKEKQELLKTQIMAEAAKDAKEKAGAVMSALDQHLGRAKSVRLETEYQPYRYYSYDLAFESAKDVQPPTTIMPTDLTVSAKLTVVFEILP